MRDEIRGAVKRAMKGRKVPRIPPEDPPRHIHPAVFCENLKRLVDVYGGLHTVALQTKIRSDILQQWMQGETEPTLSQLRFLCLYFGEDIRSIVGILRSRRNEAKALGVIKDYNHWVQSRVTYRLQDTQPIYVVAPLRKPRI